MNTKQTNDLHQHLLDMLGAKDHQDAGRIIGELHAAKAHPSRGVVDDAMVTRYLDAVHEYLGGLTKKQWQAERQDNAAALRRAARIGLTAALEGQAAALPADQHPDDAAVDRFAAVMKAKLAEARAKGRGGWHEPDLQQRLSDMLREHVDKGDPRDVANFACFLFNRGEAIAPAALPAVPEGESVTLTVAQIADLARFAGLTLAQPPQPTADELEAQITVCECPDTGVLLDGEDADPGLVAHYTHTAYYSEYPGEGCIGLGPELVATPKDQPAQGEG